MAWRVKSENVEDLLLALRNLDADVEKILKKGMYDAAAKIEDAVQSEIDALPIDEGYKPEGVKRNGVKRWEKEDLKAHVGIARFANENHKISTAIGFEGYGSLSTKEYPKGLPMPLLARSLEAGSSVREKIPFVRRAVKRCRNEVQEILQKQLEDEIDKRFKGAG